jgi:glutaredoxin
MNIIYSKPSCPYCVKAKQLLQDRKIEFVEHTLGVDIQADELFALFEGKGLERPRTAPQIFINNEYIGGYDQLVTYIEETGYNGTGYTL